MAAVGLPCCSWAFSSCGEWGLISSCGPQALGVRASVAAACWLSSFGLLALGLAGLQ